MKITKYALAGALGLFALVAPSGARADTIFIASGTFQDGSTLSGTLTINTATGLITSADLIVQYNISPSVTETFANILGQTPSTVDLEGNLFSSLFFDISASTLMGYSGGALCSTSVACAGSIVTDVSPANGITGVPFNDFLTSGMLTSTVATAPEPSTVVLLAAGLLGLMCAMRWKRLA